MPSLQQTRRRIGSVKNTQKITKAMKLVSAAKLRRAQERILAARPYADQMAALLAQLGRRVDSTAHPLLRQPDGNKVEIIVVSADRGLCGSFNAQVFRNTMELAQRLESEGRTVSLTTIGKKARDFFRRRPWPVTKSWLQLFDRLQFDQAKQVAQELVDLFLSGQRHEVRLVFTEFRSVASQRVTIQPFLPAGQGAQASTESGAGGSYLYEPDAESLLAELLPRSLAMQLFRALLESAASEQGARMMAMDSAARNAGQMINRLTLIYNKTRQATITKELMDIVGGAEALR